VIHKLLCDVNHYLLIVKNVRLYELTVQHFNVSSS